MNALSSCFTVTRNIYLCFSNLESRNEMQPKWGNIKARQLVLSKHQHNGPKNTPPYEHLFLSWGRSHLPHSVPGGLSTSCLLIRPRWPCSSPASPVHCSCMQRAPPLLESTSHGVTPGPYWELWSRSCGWESRLRVKPILNSQAPTERAVCCSLEVWQPQGGLSHGVKGLLEAGLGGGFPWWAAVLLGHSPPRPSGAVWVGHGVVRGRGCELDSASRRSSLFSKMSVWAKAEDGMLTLVRVLESGSICRVTGTRDRRVVFALPS